MLEKQFIIQMLFLVLKMSNTEQQDYLIHILDCYKPLDPESRYYELEL